MLQLVQIFITSNNKSKTTFTDQHISRQPKEKMSDTNSQKISYQAGETKGQAEEKASSMMDRAGNAAQSAKESMQEAGQQMKAKAAGAAEAVKNATGMNNNSNSS